MKRVDNSQHKLLCGVPNPVTLASRRELLFALRCTHEDEQLLNGTDGRILFVTGMGEYNMLSGAGGRRESIHRCLTCNTSFLRASCTLRMAA